MATKIEQALAALTTAVEVSNQKWDEQTRVNKVVLRKLDEYGRAIHGSNSDEGLVGEGKTRDGRIKVLEKFQAGHEDDVKWALRSAAGSFLLFVGGVVTAAVCWVFGWK